VTTQHDERRCDGGRYDVGEKGAKEDKVLVGDEAQPVPTATVRLGLAQHELRYGLDERHAPGGAQPEREGTAGHVTTVTKGVFETQEGVHADEGEVETGVVAKEQVGGDPELAQRIAAVERS